MEHLTQDQETEPQAIGTRRRYTLAYESLPFAGELKYWVVRDTRGSGWVAQCFETEKEARGWVFDREFEEVFG